MLRLATDTPTLVVVPDLVEHDQPNHWGNSCKQSKNKQKQDNMQLNCRWETQTNLNTRNLGFWKLETGSLANSASPAEVARAKSNQQNPICSWWLRGYIRGGEDDQDVVRVLLQP
jgi:hypothetical protein